MSIRRYVPSENRLPPTTFPGQFFWTQIWMRAASSSNRIFRSWHRTSVLCTHLNAAPFPFFLEVNCRRSKTSRTLAEWREGRSIFETRQPDDVWATLASLSFQFCVPFKYAILKSWLLVNLVASRRCSTTLHYSQCRHVTKGEGDLNLLVCIKHIIKWETGSPFDEENFGIFVFLQLWYRQHH